MDDRIAELERSLRDANNDRTALIQWVKKLEQKVWKECYQLPIVKRAQILAREFPHFPDRIGAYYRLTRDGLELDDSELGKTIVANDSVEWYLIFKERLIESEELEEKWCDDYIQELVAESRGNEKRPVKLMEFFGIK